MHRTLRVNIVLRIIEHNNRLPGHQTFKNRYQEHFLKLVGSIVNNMERIISSGFKVL